MTNRETEGGATPPSTPDYTLCGDVARWEVRGHTFTYRCNKPAGHGGDHREDFNISGAGVSWSAS